MRIRQSNPVPRWTLPLLAAAALIGALIWLGMRSGPAPQIAIEPGAKLIGKSTPITIRLSETQRGLSAVRVELVQGDWVSTLTDTTYPAPPKWALWRTGKTADEIHLTIGKETLPDLRPGTATLRVSASGTGALLRSPKPISTQLDLPVQFTPPALEVVSIRTYVAQGGVEAVVYRVGESATRDGVRVGQRVYDGHPLPGGGKLDRFALFAVPYDMDDPAGVRLFAIDGAGNEAQARFIDQFFAKPLRKDKIPLNDNFLEKVTSEIFARTAELINKGNPLDNYLEINRDLRKTNQAFLEQLARSSAPAFLWHEPFLPMINTAIKAHFAERRSYVYQDREVDSQDHLGLDMASTHAAPVPAANDGVVAFAGYLGIYGNCVVIDHGLGLQTLYGHLSAIDVKVGDKITRGQVLGHSGATGLAAGDHLHFAILLQGLPVNPIEWFDRKWLHDRLKLKLGAALPFAG